MKKVLFFIATACAVCLSCTKEISQVTPETQTSVTPAQNVYTLTVKANKAATKALAADGTATWATGEKVLVFKEGTATSIGTLNPQSEGAATAVLKGSVDLTGVKADDKLDLVFIGKDTDGQTDIWTYKGQNGTLQGISDNYDYATAQVTVNSIDSGNAGTSDATFANHQFIVKFSLKDANGDPLSATKFTISAGSGKLVQSYSTADGTFTPVYGDVEVTPSAATTEIYVALRNDSGAADRYLLTATSGGVDYVYAKSGVNFSNGTIYQKNMKLYGLGTYTIVGSLSDVLDWDETSSTNDLSLITEGEDIGKYGITLDVPASAGFEYKIIQDHAWTTTWPSSGNWNYGYKTSNDAFYPGANWLHVVFDPGAGSVAFYPEAKVYNLTGTFNNWNTNDTDYQMTKQSDGTYTLKRTHVEPGTFEYKVVGNNSFGWAYGNGVDPMLASNPNFSYTVTSPCDLIFTFNYRTGAITVEESYPAMSISIGGGFDDWASGYEVTGDTKTERNGLLKMKAVGDNKNLYVYLEIKNDHLDYTTEASYSNILTIFMSDGTGTSSWSYWTQMFNKYPNIWIIKDKVLTFLTYDITGLSSYFVLDGDIVKVELCIPRSYNSLLNSDTALIGAIITGQYVQENEWKGSSDATGVVPAKYENMCKVFFQ